MPASNTNIIPNGTNGVSNLDAHNQLQENGFLKQKPGFATKAIHVAQDPDQWNSAAVVTPIVTSTTYKQSAPGVHKGYEYSRSGNPTRNVLEEVLASLDNGKHGMCFASGLGAITCIASMLDKGDHILSGDDLYGGTNRLFRQVFARLFLDLSFMDFADTDNLEKALRPNTKMVWLESPTNPLLKVVDITKIVSIVKSYNPAIMVVVDNTFLSSYLQRPLDFGADIVMYSLTKYMNGHSDVVMGATVVNDDKIAEQLRFLQNAMGVVPAPFDCYQVTRSLKTLAVRMRQHMESGLVIARWLEKHPNVLKVLHPGLPSHPQYELSRRQTYGHSGMITVYLQGGLEQSRTFLSSLKVFILAESLGGYESLAELPSIMTHASVPAEQRAELGITDSLVRLSVGLEDVEDLLADLAQALQVAFPAKA